MKSLGLLQILEKEKHFLLLKRNWRLQGVENDDRQTYPSLLMAVFGKQYSIIKVSVNVLIMLLLH